MKQLCLILSYYNKQNINCYTLGLYYGYLKIALLISEDKNRDQYLDYSNIVLLRIGLFYCADKQKGIRA